MSRTSRSCREPVPAICQRSSGFFTFHRAASCGIFCASLSLSRRQTARISAVSAPPWFLRFPRKLLVIRRIQGQRDHRALGGEGGKQAAKILADRFAGAENSCQRGIVLGKEGDILRQQILLRQVAEPDVPPLGIQPLQRCQRPRVQPVHGQRRVKGFDGRRKRPAPQGIAALGVGRRIFVFRAGLQRRFQVRLNAGAVKLLRKHLRQQLRRGSVVTSFRVQRLGWNHQRQFFQLVHLNPFQTRTFGAIRVRTNSSNRRVWKGSLQTVLLRSGRRRGFGWKEAFP